MEKELLPINYDNPIFSEGMEYAINIIGMEKLADASRARLQEAKTVADKEWYSGVQSGFHSAIHAVDTALYERRKYLNS